MKFALILLVALPMVFCMEERNILDAFKHQYLTWLDQDQDQDYPKEKLFDNQELHNVVSGIVNLVGSDATEAQCEGACNRIAHNAVVSSGCPLLCKSFQALVQHFGIH